MTPLYMPLNQAVVTIAAKLFPKGFDTTDTLADAPQSLDQLRDHIRRTGRMLVYAGHSDHTIFGDAGVNQAFRAWHEHCHLRASAQFTTDGEYATFQQQANDLVKLYGLSNRTYHMIRLVHAEVVGQVAYANKHRKFPDNQRAFVQAYLWNAREAMEREFPVGCCAFAEGMEDATDSMTYGAVA